MRENGQQKLYNLFQNKFVSNVGAFDHPPGNMFWNTSGCCKLHETEFWLDKTTRESHRTRELRHLLENKFALDP